ncbi:MAG TPA: PH domain-containing protein [Kouleothrix sp.]|uniref:PH domain-containing protein n=1 Tax=Kouleothrix sp. TaxID=2779161 RepID=UPI002BEC1A7A|nr:PH domain-containing protein [Kouleothrix sp.]HRC75222.1 PH domain-containing protein [Kouleothrix sp.]
MAYIDELLARDEKVLYDGRQHTFVLVGNIITETVLIGVLIAAGVTASTAFANRIALGLPVGQLILAGCGLISLFVLISAFFDYLRWNNEQYIVTDQRVIQIRGVLNKDVIDSSLDKINDVELRQSWLGRIFDYGTIEILTASDVGINEMRQIAHPLDFKRAMLEAKHNFARGFGYLDPAAVTAYTQPAAGSGDLQQTLQKLADLRDQGLLSVDEFEAKKRELLNRI